MAIPAFSAGENLPASDLQSLSDALTPTLDTLIGTASAGFTATSQRALTVANGTAVFIDLIVTNASQIVATAGDITDAPMFTLDSQYWPDQGTTCSFSTGHVGGTISISTAGVCNVVTSSDTIVTSASIHFSVMYLNAS